MHHGSTTPTPERLLLQQPAHNLVLLVAPLARRRRREATATLPAELHRSRCRGGGEVLLLLLLGNVDGVAVVRVPGLVLGAECSSRVYLHLHI
jgi:hypothetical protein